MSPATASAVPGVAGGSVGMGVVGSAVGTVAVPLATGAEPVGVLVGLVLATGAPLPVVTGVGALAETPGVGSPLLGADAEVVGALEIPALVTPVAVLLGPPVPAA